MGPSHYVKILDTNKGFASWAHPTFICELVGPHFVISGAVYGEHIFVDRLTRPIWLTPTSNDCEAMVRKAKVLAALKQSVLKLASEYFTIRNKPVLCPRYPTFQEFDLHGKAIPLKYIKRLQQHVFLCSGNDQKFVTKFTTSYNGDCHSALASEGLAPILFHCGNHGKFKAIVMEYIEDFCFIEDYLRDACTENKEEAKRQCYYALEVMKKKSYCHGDLRPCNILVDKNGIIKIIDFDWAGELHQVRYPPFMNHEQITWPEGAAEGCEVTHAHDQFFIANLF